MAVHPGPTNPLLATFAVFIGLLLWFRLVGIITLVAAAWIAVAAQDADIPLMALTEDERRLAEYKAIAVAAEVGLREARASGKGRRGIRTWQAERNVRQAEAELERVKELEPRRTERPASSLPRDDRRVLRRRGSPCRWR